jgi:hypothetical protein
MVDIVHPEFAVCMKRSAPYNKIGNLIVTAAIEISDIMIGASSEYLL